jgi:hypothetical protein
MDVTRVPRSALVVNDSVVANDPRVLRQIEWLSDAGWTVDTLGQGDTPGPRVRRHYALRAYAGIRRSPLVRLVVHAVLPPSAQFRALDAWRIPPELLSQAGRYDLVVANDIELLPWITGIDRSALLTAAGRVHLDVHEFHEWAPQRGAQRLLGGRLGRYHSWLVSQIGNDVFDSRSTVAQGIAQKYAAAFGMPVPSIIRNAPPYYDLSPSTVEQDRIELVYHGNADRDRGLGLLVEAMGHVPARFRLNLMLTGSPADRLWLEGVAAALGDAVRFVEPVAMADVPLALNSFDVEVIFFPPVTNNLRFALPNKFFEAVQARLGVVIGESSEMIPLVREFGLGVIVSGWASTDLAEALERLDAEAVRALKLGSDAAAHVLNSDTERERFLAIIDHSTPETD